MVASVYLCLLALIGTGFGAAILGVQTSENFTHSSTLDTDGNFILLEVQRYRYHF